MTVLPISTTNPRAQRDRLQAARDRTRAAREALARSRRDFQAAKESGDQAGAEAALASLERALSEKSTAEQLETSILSQIAGMPDELGRTLATSLEAQETLKGIASSSAPLSSYVRVGDFMTQEELVGWTGRSLAVTPGLVTTPGDLGTSQPVGIQPTPEPPRTLLDLIGSVPVRDRKVSYLQRSGGIAQAGVQVNPGDLKQQAGIDYVEAEVEVETVATWTKLDRIDVDDIPGLQQDAQQALNYGLRVEIESLLLAAILGATGIQAPDVSADANVPDKLLTAVGQLSAAGVAPTFIAMNPTDLTAAYKVREGTDGAYLAGPPWDKLPPIVPSVALAQGTALAGDSRIGAKLGVRSGIALALGTESDDLVRNRITMLLETRIAPLVPVPAAFSSFSLLPPAP